jgi:hypothetical protein
MVRTLTVRREAYRRKGYIRKGGIKVAPARVPSATYKIRDIGAPGRGAKRIKIGRPGALKVAGYSTKLSAEARHRALKEADRRYGTVALFRMLQAQIVFRKRVQPATARIFEADRNWAKDNLMSRQEALSMTRAPRKEWIGMSPAERAEAMPGGQ